MKYFINIKKSLYFFIFCGSLGPLHLMASSLSCEVSAPIALLINAEDGKVLFSKNAETPCYPASTTKIATALYGLHKKGDFLDLIVKTSSDAVGAVSPAVRRSSGKHPSYRLEFGGTHMGLKSGEEMALKDLFYGLMLPSGNDAANVIAETVSGSVPQFMEELNSYLREIGCTNTHFTNPHGLPDLEHMTTAKDLALMAQLAMKNSFFQKVVSSPSCIRPATNKQPETVLGQNNALVKPTNKHYYPHATGIKTGYTVKSGYLVVASAKKDDRSLIAVICHFEGAAQRNRSAIQLFETAFKEVKQTRKLFSQEYDLFQQKVEGAKEIVKGVLEKDVIVNFYPSEEPVFHSKLEWMSLSLPIQAGEKIGEMFVFDDQNILKEAVAILAIKNVYPTFLYEVEKVIQKGREWVRKQRIPIAYSLAILLFTGAFWRFFIRGRVFKKKGSGIVG